MSGNEVLVLVLLIAAGPLVGYAIGLQRTRNHFWQQKRFRRYGAWVVAPYYGAAVVTYAIMLAVDYVSGGEVGFLQLLGCFLLVSGPLLGLVLIIRGEDFRRWRIPTHCRKCGYPIGLSRVCPECGTAQDPPPQEQN